MFEKLKKTFSSFIDKVSTHELSVEKLEPIFEEFKVTLLENDVALVVADKIVEELKVRLQGLRVKRFKENMCCCAVNIDGVKF